MAIDSFMELQERMDLFQEKLHQILGNRKLKLLQVVDSYREDVRKLELKHEEISTQLNQLTEQETKLENDIEFSQKQHDETTTKINSYRIRKEQLEAEKVSLTKETEELKTLLAQKQLEIKRRKQALLTQRQKDYPDVRIYERLLGLKVDATKPDTLRFTFDQVSGSDLSLLCEVILDLSSENYKVLETSPKLNTETISTLEERLNSTGDLPLFLKLMRTLLIDALPS